MHSKGVCVLCVCVCSFVLFFAAFFFYFASSILLLFLFCTCSSVSNTGSTSTVSVVTIEDRADSACIPLIYMLVMLYKKINEKKKMAVVMAHSTHSIHIPIHSTYMLYHTHILFLLHVCCYCLLSVHFCYFV